MSTRNARVLVIGNVAIETKVFLSTAQRELLRHESYTELCDVQIADAPSGGGWLSAMAARALDCETVLLSTIGGDSDGQFLVNEMKRLGIEFRGDVCADAGSLRFVSLIVSGEPHLLLASPPPDESHRARIDLSQERFDIGILGYSTVDRLEQVASQLRSRSCIFVANLSRSVLDVGPEVLEQSLPTFTVVSMNESELSEIGRITGKSKDETIRTIVGPSSYLLLTSASGAVAIRNGKTAAEVRSIPFTPRDATGAGDGFAVGFAFGLNRGLGVQECLTVGQRVALGVLGAHSKRGPISPVLDESGEKRESK